MARAAGFSRREHRLWVCCCGMTRGSMRSVDGGTVTGYASHSARSRVTHGQAADERSKLRALRSEWSWCVHLTRRTLLTLAGAAVPISPLAAQQWPARNIRMLV